MSISFVYDKVSWSMLMAIQNYFKIEMTRVDTSDWDLVEETVKRVIKSSRAAPDYKPSSDVTM